MIKNFTALELKVGERIYKFLCDVDAPLGEVHDVLCQMKGFVIKTMSDIQNPPKEEPKKEDTSCSDCSECEKGEC